MPEQQAEVMLVFRGQTQNLKAALGDVHNALGQFAAETGKAAASAEGKLKPAAHGAGHEVKGLGERARVAAEMIGTLGAESSEAVLKVRGLSNSFKEMEHTFGGFSGALSSMIGGLIVFKALDFGHEAVDAALEGEQATAAYNNALSKTPGLVEATNKSLEAHKDLYTHLGLDDSAVKGLAARAAGAGLDPRMVTDNISAWGDVAVAIGAVHNGVVDYGAAVDAATHGTRGLSQVMRGLNLSDEQKKDILGQLQAATGPQRSQVVLDMIEHSKFAGSAGAQADTTVGKFNEFHTAVQGLQEEVGTALLPALGDLAEAMTHLLQILEHITQPFGGLANVLKIMFIPMLTIGLRMFLGLKGSLTDLADRLLGRVVGGFTQTATSLSDASSEAKNLVDSIRTIPESWTTVATFISGPASATKDLYKGNIFSIPPTWTTKAIFEPAAVDAATPLAEAQKIVDATPVVIPEEMVAPTVADITAMGETLRTRLEEEIAAKGGVGVSTHLDLPTQDMAQIYLDQTTKMLNQEIAKLPKLTADLQASITAKDDIKGALPGIFSRAQAYMNKNPLKWVINAAGNLTQGMGTGAAMAGGFAIAGQIFQSAKFYQPAFTLNKVPWSPADQATLDSLRKRLDQPLTVKVQGKVDVGAIGGSVTGLTLGTQDRDLLRKHIATLEAQKKAAEAYIKAMDDARKHPLPVSIAMDWGEVARMIGEVAMGTIIANLAMQLLSPGRILGWLKGGLGKLGDLFGKGGGGGKGPGGKGEGPGGPGGDLMNDLGKILQMMPTQAPESVPQNFDIGKAGASLAAGVAALISKINWKQALKTVTLVSLPFALADLVAHSLKGINWGTTLKNVGSAAGIALGVAAAVGTFIGGAFKLLGSLMQGPSAAPGFSAGDLKKAGYVNPAPSFAKFVGDIIGGGIKLAWNKLKDIGGGIIDAIIDGIKHAWAKLPGPIPWIWGGDKPKHGDLSIGGKNYPEFIKKGDKPPAAPAGYKYVAVSNKPGFDYELEETTKHGPRPIGGGFTGRYGGIGGGLGLGDLTGQLGDIIGGSSTSKGKAVAAGHTTFNATFHINGAKDPHAVATQIEKALEQFVAGAKSQKRLAG